jgi:uncharacterized protein (DUF2461 family)
MFRIYRDAFPATTAVQTHLGIHFFHEKAKAAASVPGFICTRRAASRQPASIPIAVAREDSRHAKGSPQWKAIKRSKLKVEGASLKRPPRGFAPDHPMIEDLKRTDFVTSAQLSEKEITGKNFMADFAASCRKMSPLVRFVARSLKLAW